MEKRKRGRPAGTFKYEIDGKPCSIYSYRKHLAQLRKLGEFDYILKDTIQKKNNSYIYSKKIKKKRNAFEYKIEEQVYINKTLFCALCGFNKYAVDLHHIDRNKANNKESNLIGLCPNCHLGIHRNHIKISEDSLRRLVYQQKQDAIFKGFCFVLQ